MPNWRKIWNEYPTRFAREDFLKQVGKTTGGAPFPQDQTQKIVHQIRCLLDLQPNDRLLDLCCGNGFLTYQIAPFCREITGIDFSMPLIDIANQYHSASNITYHCLSAFDLQSITLPRFDKVLMYEGLQFFAHKELEPLIEQVLSITEPHRIILFGSIPERRRKGEFYDSPGKLISHWIRSLRNRDLMGTWWDRRDFLTVAQKWNLLCDFPEHDQGMLGAHYRFNVKLY